MHYFKFNIGDYASHTRHLSLLEDLAYRKLLDLYYLHEQPFNMCSTDVARLIGMRENLAEVEAVLREFFVKTDSGWLNSRADFEIQEYKKDINNKSKAGKASADARAKNKRSTVVQQTFNSCSTDVQLNTKQETRNKKQLNSRGDATATRLPTDWQPDQAYLAFCRNERPDLDPHKVAESFRDYWISAPGAKGKKQDWMATWRNWVRNQRHERPQNLNFMDDRKNTLDQLTGRNKHGQRTEIDITAESSRVAGFLD